MMPSRSGPLSATLSSAPTSPVSLKSASMRLARLADASCMSAACSGMVGGNPLSDRKQALTFVIVGAGPTGVEFTAELRDFIEEDVVKYYPHLLPVSASSISLSLTLGSLLVCCVTPDHPDELLSCSRPK
eukprot:9693-Eustigmatos_ZCMA.PRE.1